MIGSASRPRLASKARLRLDRLTGKHVILYPERGLELTATGAAITELCTGELTVTQMINELMGTYPGEPRNRLETEVLVFLRALDDRGLLREGQP